MTNEDLQQINETRDKLNELLNQSSYLKDNYQSLFQEINNLLDNFDSLFSKSNGQMDSILSKSQEVTNEFGELFKHIGKVCDLLDVLYQKMDDINALNYENADVVKELTAEIEKWKISQESIQNSLDTKKYSDIKEEIVDINQQIDIWKQKQEEILDDDVEIVDQHKDILEAQKDITEETEKTAKARGKNKERIKREKEDMAALTGFMRETWNFILGIGKSGADKWLEVDQATHDFGRQMGMNAEQMEAHGAHAMQTYGDMARKLGMEFKDLYKFQTMYADVTEKSVLLSTEQVTSMAAVSKNTGEEAVSVASKNLDTFATSADATIEYLAKGSARAALEGLNVKKYSEAFAKNIKMASKYTFKEGINGIQKMTLLSQRLKFDMESIGAAMEKFSTLEGAIEASAQLQVLGGSFAANFGNPLEAFSDALLDAESFTDRIVNSVANMARFDAKTGEINLSVVDKQRMKAAAQAMGISYEELFNMTTQKRKGAEIDKAVGHMNLSEEQKAFLANKAQYDTKTQKWTLQMPDGSKIEDIRTLDSSKIDELRNRDTHEKVIASDVSKIHKLLVERAQSEKSMPETIKGFEESIKMGIASFIDGLPVLGQLIVAGLASSSIMGGAASLMGRGLLNRKKMNRAMPKAERIAKVGLKKMGRTFGLTNNAAAARASGGKMASFISTHGGGKAAQGISKVASVGGKALKLGGKLAGPLSIAVGAVEGVMAYSNYNDAKADVMMNKKMNNTEKAIALNEAKKERNQGYGSAIGGVAGAAIGQALIPIPVVGAMFGGFVGSKLGSWIGESVTESTHDTLKEIEQEENKNENKDNIESEVTNKISDNVSLIEREVLGISSKLGILNSTLASSNGVYGRSINTNEIYVRENSMRSTDVKISDMKINVGGEIKLMADNRLSGKVDLKELLYSPDFSKRVVAIVQSSINGTPSSRVQTQQAQQV